MPFVRVLYADKLDADDWHKPFPFKPQFIEGEQDLKKHFEGKITPAQANRLKPRSERPIAFIIWRSSVWRQLHRGEDTFIRSHSPYITSSMLARLKDMKTQDIRQIFSEAKNEVFLNVPYFIPSFLERRDQVIKLPVYTKDN